MSLFGGWSWTKSSMDRFDELTEEPSLIEAREKETRLYREAHDMLAAADKDYSLKQKQLKELREAEHAAYKVTEEKCCSGADSA